MQLSSILTPERTLHGAPGSSKKRVLENIASFICEDISTLDPLKLFEKLVEREKLGSTGLGKGIAIPHCRITNCTSVIGTLITLDNPVDFDAIDGQKVDLLFILLVPEEAHEEHLKALAKLAELFSQQQFCDQLRSSKDSEALYNNVINAI